MKGETLTKWVVIRHAPRSQGGCVKFFRESPTGEKQLNQVVAVPSRVTCPRCIEATQLPIGATQ